MNLRPGIEIDFPFLVALAEDNALPFLEIDIFPIELDQLPDTHSGRGEQVDDSKVAGVFAMISHDLQRFIRIGFLDGFAGFDLVDPAHRAFQDQVFLLQPGEEAGQDATNIVHRHLAGVVSTLIAV